MNEFWDQRIARRMVRPLTHTFVTPNHLTTLRLIVGLIAVTGFSTGIYFWSNMAAIGFVVSNLLDHTDGELARITGQTSTFGHYYDLVSDALIYILFFVCIGIGVQRSMPDSGAMLMGFLAGISVASIFWFRMKIESWQGKASVRQPYFLGFELEDILYLVPFITLLNGLKPFLVLAAMVSPWVAIFLGWKYFRIGKSRNLN